MLSYFYIILGFLLCLFTNSVYGQKIAVADSVAQIKFEETSHDFGTSYEGDKLEYTFVFQNIGKKPLSIANVLTTCGCTASKWTKKVILPNEKGEILVRFDTKGKDGQQTKIITVISNAYNAKERLFIRTVVTKKEEN